ncbi:MAG TPA: TerB family tellurite resistance protein [Longimicrobiales bacterium]|nr:TerB family tellurite resistance protein [Longimicrobiales bacterium]
MSEPIRSFFERRIGPGPAGNGGEGDGAVSDELSRTRLHLAACALLLELAHADEGFGSLEREHIEAVLRRHFDLDAGTAREVIEVADADRRAANDVHPFAALIRERWDQGQRTLLAEIMWGLIVADGEIARHEAHLLGRITSLLDLEPGYLSEPRRG